MKKIVIDTMFCLLLELLPPITVGISTHQTSEGKPAVNEWTCLEGVIVRHRHVEINDMDCVTFNALFVHYTTHSLGNIRSGFFYQIGMI